MKLRFLFFAVSLAVSVYFGLYTENTTGGWLAAVVIAAAGLGWTAWDEPGLVRSPGRPWPVLPSFPQDLEGPLANDAGLSLTVPSLSSSTIPIAAPVAGFSSFPGGIGGKGVFEDYFMRVPVPLIVIDVEGRITVMNQAAEVVTQFAVAEVRSAPYWQLFLDHNEAQKASKDYFAAMLDRNAPPRREVWRTRTGGQAEFEWWRTVLKDGFGQSSGVIAAALPIPPPETHAVDLATLADQLTAVNGYSQFLLMSMDEQDPHRSDLESIYRAGLAASSSLAGTSR